MTDKRIKRNSPHLLQAQQTLVGLWSISEGRLNAESSWSNKAVFQLISDRVTEREGEGLGKCGMDGKGRFQQPHTARTSTACLCVA